MSVERYESMWFTVNQYDFKIDLNRYSDLSCIICHKLLTEAMQSSCSCKFCRRCIEYYLRNGNQTCPGSLELCKTTVLDLLEDVIIDHTTNKRISLIKVKCPFEKCYYEDKLINIDSHINQCDMKILQTNQTDLSIENLELINHVQIDEIIHLKLLIESIDNLRNENKLLSNEISSIKQIQNTTYQLQEQFNNLNDKIDQIILNQKALCVKMNVDYNEEKLFQRTREEISTHKSDRKKESIKSKGNLGELIWRIEDFINTKKKLLYGNDRWLDSVEFYSNPNRYKMQIRLWIGDPNIDLLIKMLPCDNDKEIQWPIKCEVIMGILNPENGKYVINETKIIEYQSINYKSKSYFHFANSTINKYSWRSDVLVIKCSVKDISLNKQNL